MSLSIHFAHTGQLLSIPIPIRYHRQADFKEFLAEQFGIPDVSAVFILTSFGLKLNFGVINELNAVYVYDKRFFGEEQIPDGPILSVQTVLLSLKLLLHFTSNFIHETEKPFDRHFSQIRLMSSRTLHMTWQEKLEELKRLPTIEIGHRGVVLAEMLNVDELEISAKHIEDSLPKVVQKFNSVNQEIARMSKGRDEVAEMINKLNERVVKDGKSVLSLLDSRPILQKVAGLQMQNVKIHEWIKNLSRNTKVDNQAVSRATIQDILVYQDYLSLTVDLPLLFGLLLIELRREREWADYFSDGLVSTVSDTLANIADNERKFRRIWLLKLGKSLGKLNYSVLGAGTCALHNALPNVEVSLSGQNGTVFEHLSELEVQRDDIVRYLDVVKNKLLTKTYKDLLKSTGKMRAMTKAVGLLDKEENLEESGSLSMISDLRSRIRILENLLHQQRLRNLDAWPGIEEKVVESTLMERTSSNETPSERTPTNERMTSPISNSVDHATNGKPQMRKMSTLPSITSIPTGLFSPTRLLGKNEIKSPPVSLDASVVDKHLLNIRLRKELETLKSDNTKLEEEVNQLKEEKAIFRSKWIKEMESLEGKFNDESMKMKAELEEVEKRGHQSILEKESDLKNLADIVKENKATIELLEQTISDNKQTIALLEQTIKKHKEEISQKAILIGDKNLLLSGKDREIQDMDDEIKRLTTRANELSDENARLAKAREADRKEMAREFEKEKASLVEKYEKMMEQREMELKEAFKKERETLLEKNVPAEPTLELAEALTMNSDLLSNLAAKEAEFQNERKSLEGELKALQQKLDEKNDEYETLLEKLNDKEYEENDEITEITEKYEKVQQEYRDLQKELESVKSEYTKELEAIKSEYGDVQKELKKVQNDNVDLQHKYTEKASECDSLSEDNKLKETKLSRTLSDYDHLQDTLDEATTRANKLSLSIATLKGTHEVIIGAFQKLVEANYTYFVEICLVLESMGLLLTKDGKDMRISRVKGLRNKESEEVPTSSVVGEVEKRKNDVVLQLGNIESNQNTLDASISAYISTNPSDHFFLKAISRRFKDVEGFAKKQTKENKASSQEIVRLQNRLNSKISVNSFAKGDLVLFLPTRIERDDGVDVDEVQPWAAFNMGAPHYFLKGEHQNKAWLVARVENIEEYRVTTENHLDKEKNPFNLSVGVVWYLVEIKK